MDNEKTSRIEELKRKLYRREKQDFSIKRTDLTSSREDELPRTWEKIDNKEQESREGSDWVSPIFKIVAWTAAAFFVVAIAGAAYLWIQGTSVISNRNIDVVIRGPAVVKAGSISNFNIVVTNKNRKALEAVDLIIEFPRGTTDLSGQQSLSRVRQSLGNINPGRSVSRTNNAVIFGGEGEVLPMKIFLEYRVIGSNVVFEKGEKYDIAINASPLVLAIETPQEIISNQAMEVKVRVRSNAEVDLANVLLTVNYPPGFQFQSASVSPSYDNNTWLFNQMKTGDEKEIVIRGVLEGQADETKAFRATTGRQDPTGPKNFDLILAEDSQSMTVRRPFVALNLRVNEQTGTSFVSNAGTTVVVSLDWVNNLTSRVVDAEVEIKINGSNLDKSRVSASPGFYRSSDSMIIWNRNSLPSLREIAPGGRGTLSFRFDTLPNVNGSQAFLNPRLDIEVKFRGLRVDPGVANEMIETVVNRSILFNTSYALLPQVIYSIGAFDNTGPIPPRVDQTTTYSVVWTITNSSNNIREAVVWTTLPPYVEWAEGVSPEGEEVVYHPRTRELIWNVGSVSAASGYGVKPRELQFQLRFTPSLSQLGIEVPLTSGIVLEGVDNYTQTVVRQNYNPVSTKMESDPIWRQGMGTVNR
jgi:hypothetical protein